MITRAEQPVLARRVPEQTRVRARFEILSPFPQVGITESLDAPSFFLLFLFLFPGRKNEACQETFTRARNARAEAVTRCLGRY